MRSPRTTNPGARGRPRESDPLKSEASAYAYLRKTKSAELVLHLALYAARARGVARTELIDTRTTREGKRLPGLLEELRACLRAIHPAVESDESDEELERRMPEHARLWVELLYQDAQEVLAQLAPQTPSGRALLRCSTRTRWIAQILVATSTKLPPEEDGRWIVEISEPPGHVELMCLARLARCKFIDRTVSDSRADRLADWGRAVAKARELVNLDDAEIIANAKRSQINLAECALLAGPAEPRTQLPQYDPDGESDDDEHAPVRLISRLRQFEADFHTTSSPTNRRLN